MDIRKSGDFYNYILEAGRRQPPTPPPSLKVRPMTEQLTKKYANERPKNPGIENKMSRRRELVG